MDPLDDLLTQLEGVEEPKEVHQDDNSDDEDLYIRKKELSEEGFRLERYLKKNSSSSGPKATDAFKSTKKSMLTGLTKPSNEAVSVGIIRFDKFQISCRNPKISSSSFGAFTAGMKLEKLSDLKLTSSFKEAWCTMAVIVEKGFKKKSANGNDFLIWKLHDLRDCQTPPVKLLMFGDAIKEHWEIKLGSVIGLISAQIAEDSNASGSKKPSVTLKVAKANNIIEIGASAHYGTCKGTRQQDGQKCQTFVNTSLSEFCVFHVMSAARKLSAKRGVFNAVTCGPNVGGLSLPKIPKTPRPSVPNRSGMVSSGLSSCSGSPMFRETMRPADSNSMSTPTSSLKQTTKEEQRSALKDIISERKNTFAARQLLELKKKKDAKSENLDEMIEFLATGAEKEKPEKHESFGAFLKADTEKEKEKERTTVDLGSRIGKSSSSESPLWSMSMGRKPVMGHKDAQEHAARLRAIAVLKAKKKEQEQTGGTKRKATAPVETDPEAKKTKSGDKMDEIRKMLARKSSHHSEAKQEEADAIQRHLTGMEEREKVETFTTTCMEVKNVKVVTCKQCKYTSQFAAPDCYKKEHQLVKHTADKRFFKCVGCKKRTVCFEMMPIKHCQHCNENKWERVAMKDERKVVLEVENLKVRGEERTFVNS